MCDWSTFLRLHLRMLRDPKRAYMLGGCCLLLRPRKSSFCSMRQDRRSVKMLCCHGVTLLLIACSYKITYYATVFSVGLAHICTPSITVSGRPSLRGVTAVRSISSNQPAARNISISRPSIPRLCVPMRTRYT